MAYFSVNGLTHLLKLNTYEDIKFSSTKSFKKRALDYFGDSSQIFSVLFSLNDPCCIEQRQTRYLE